MHGHTMFKAGMNALELHAEMRKPRIGYERRKQIFQKYAEVVKPICDRLLFTWKLVGASSPSNNHNGINYATYHIVLEEEFVSGRMRRRKGDALCKKLERFNGNLWATPYDGAVLDCKACLGQALKIIRDS